MPTAIERAKNQFLAAFPNCAKPISPHRQRQTTQHVSLLLAIFTSLASGVAKVQVTVGDPPVFAMGKDSSAPTNDVAGETGIALLNSQRMLAVFDNYGVRIFWVMSSNGHEWLNWRRYLSIRIRPRISCSRRPLTGRIAGRLTK